MTAQLPEGSVSSATAVAPRALTAAPSWAWRRSALLLSVAAQLITISALVAMHSPAHNWARLLLAVGPVPLAAATLLVPRPARLVAIVAFCAAVVAGIAGGLLPTGVLFFPALAAMIGAGFFRRRDRS